MPTTSLGDLNSKFTIQGDPTLPRLTVTGFFTGQTSIAGPDAGSDYFAVKDSLSITRGNHSFKFGGEISTRRSCTTRCSTTTASSRSTAARPATPTPTSCSAFPRR